MEQITQIRKAPGETSLTVRFFSATSEAMRRILVHHARDKQRVKCEGGMDSAELDENGRAVARTARNRRRCQGADEAGSPVVEMVQLVTALV